MKARWEYDERVQGWVLAIWAADGVPTDVLGTMPAGTLTAIPARTRKAVAEAAQRQHGVMPPARVFDGPPGAQVSMTCGVCWSVSFNPNDARERYCGHCHAWPELDDQLAKSGPPAVD